MNGYTDNSKKLKKVEKMGRNWMYFEFLTKITTDEWLQYTIPVKLRSFSRW